MPILESVTYIAKWNNGAQEVYLYYEKSYLELNRKFKIDNLDQQKLLPHRESNLLFDKLLLLSKKIKKEGFIPLC